MTGVFLILFSFAVSYVLTGAICRYAGKLSLIDMPGARSSHFIPTPRGGGLGIVISFSVCILYDIFHSPSPLDKPYYYLSAILLTAAIGFLDDRRGVPARWRFPVHLFAALLVTIPVWVNADMFNIPGRGSAGTLAFFIVVVVLAWLLNLYNFMDGIDGIAASEAVFVSLGGAALLYLAGQGQLVFILLSLGAGCGGFLLWNWPPAKIFMGDVGSGFLGLALGGIAFYSIAGSDTITVWPWLILFGVFLVDATYTLLVRLLTGQRWYVAHRSHTYQHAASRFRSHRKVTLATIVINVFWLFPFAFLATGFPEYGVYHTLIAYVPLVLLAVYFKAGTPGEKG